jgi:polyphosphate kinase 2
MGHHEHAQSKRASKDLKGKFYAKELARLQLELVKLQAWIKHQGLKVALLFEGRDAAGKGGTIKRITESLNPRLYRVVALAAPTEREKTQWYFQRYVAHLPAAGELVLFDRSWYNRAGVERVMGFCTEAEYQEFLRACPEFERMLVRSGLTLIKYWFSVSDEEQERRFQQRIQETDGQIQQVFASHEACQRLAQLAGVGPLTATALVAAVGEATTFKNGR